MLVPTRKIGEWIVIDMNREIVVAVLVRDVSRNDTMSSRCVRGLGRIVNSSGRVAFGLPKLFSRFRLRNFRGTHGSVRQPTWNSSARHGCCVLKFSRASRC